MSKYIVTRPDEEGNIISMTLEFDETGHQFLRSLQVVGTWEDIIWRNLWNYPPLSEKAFLTWNYPGNKVEEVPSDISFVKFWNDFGNKVGNKSAIEKQYNAHPDEEKIAMLKAIGPYKRYIQIMNYAQAMANTWMTQRRWENDYSTKPKIQR